MKIAVFNKEREVLGWFDYNEPGPRQRDLWVRIKSSEAWPSLQDWKPHDVRYNRRDEAHLMPNAQVIRFEWHSMMVARTLDEQYRCDVLVTEAGADELNRLPRFKWFAEEHGFKIEAVRASG